MELNKYNLNENNIHYFATYLQNYLNDNYGYSHITKYCVKIEKVKDKHLLTILSRENKKINTYYIECENYDIKTTPVKCQQNKSFENDILDCYLKFKVMLFGNDFKYSYDKYIATVSSLKI